MKMFWQNRVNVFIVCVLCVFKALYLNCVYFRSNLSIMFTVDTRTSTCYLDYRRGMCHQGLDGLFTRSMCCCSVGRAWSQQCEPCPSKGSGKSNKLKWDYTCSCDIFFICVFFSRMKLLLIGGISENYHIFQILLLVTSVIVTSGEEYLICTSSSVILKYVN